MKRSRGAFQEDDVRALPRPELALRIGQVVSQHLEREHITLNLLERRKLVSDLIEWLIKVQAEAPSQSREVTKTSTESSGA